LAEFPFSFSEQQVLYRIPNRLRAAASQPWAGCERLLGNTPAYTAYRSKEQNDKFDLQLLLRVRLGQEVKKRRNFCGKT
jgi:hypothetical protein